MILAEILYVLHHRSMGEDPKEFESNMQALCHGSEADRQLYEVIESLMRDDPASRPTAAQLLKVSSSVLPHCIH